MISGFGKNHTREGDAISAAYRRLPMTEVNPVSVVGPNGPTSLIDVFEGRDELIVYKHMFHSGQPFENQCPGCTLSVWHVHDLSYLHRRGVSFAVFAEGPWEEVAPFRDFMGYSVPWYSSKGVDDPVVGGEYGSIICLFRQGDRIFLTNEITDRGVEAIMTSMKLLDMTVYGRQEPWELSPADWPRHDDTFWFWTQDGRPTAQSSRANFLNGPTTGPDHD